MKYAFLFAAVFAAVSIADAKPRVAPPPQPAETKPDTNGAPRYCYKWLHPRVCLQWWPGGRR